MPLERSYRRWNLSRFEEALAQELSHNSHALVNIMTHARIVAPPNLGKLDTRCGYAVFD